MANQNIKKEGNLEKKSRYLGVWRKRWTVLEPKSNTTSSVSTYKKKKQYKSPTECIRIDNATDIVAYPASEQEGELLFYIQNIRDKERFLFKAESKHDRDEWIKAITAANKKEDKKDLKAIINGTQQSKPINYNETDMSNDMNNNNVTDTDNKQTDIPTDNAQKINENDKKQEEINENINNKEEVKDDDEKDIKPTDSQVEAPKEAPKEVPQEEVVKDKEVEVKPETVSDNNEQGQQQEQQHEQVNNNNNNNEVEEYNEMEETEVVQKGIEEPKTTEAVPSVEDDNKPIEQPAEPNKEIDTEKKDENENEIEQKDDEQPPKEEAPKEEAPKEEEPAKEEQTEAQPEQPKEAPKEEQPNEEQPNEEQPKEDEQQPEEPPQEAPKEEQPNEEQLKEEEAPKEDEQQPEEPAQEPPQEVVNNENDNKEAPKEEVEASQLQENDNENVQEDEQKQKEISNENLNENENENVQQEQENEQPKEVETESKPQEDVPQEEQQEEEPKEVNENKPAGLSAAIAEAKANQIEETVNEAEDKFQVDAGKKTPLYNTTGIDNNRSDSETMSQASSYRSDDGDGPFSNRWGLNDTMDDDEEVLEEENEEIDEDSIDKDRKSIDIDTTNCSYISIVVVGEKKAGKSMLVNMLVGGNNEEEKYEETKENVIRNKVFTSSEDEKDETNGILCSFIDTSGDMINIKNTISGISISDIAIVMISIEHDMDNVREYIRILNTYGIDKYICCLGYMDTIDYNKDKYETVQGKVEKMFKKIGVKAKKIAFIPVNCKSGDNICSASANDKLSWYNGWTLKKKTGMSVVDAIRTISSDAKHKKEAEPFIMPVNSNNGIICGKIEQGTINKGDTIKLSGSDNSVSVTEIKRCGQVMDKCIEGDYISVNIDGDGVESGDVLYNDNENKLNIKPCKSITALVVVNGIEKLEIGFKGIICIRSQMVLGEIVNINWKGDKKNRDAKYLGDKEQGEVVFKLEGDGIIGTTYKVCECLGRLVVITENNKVVLLGKIESVEC